MLLIKNGTVYLGHGNQKEGWDVLCENSVIKQIGPGLSAPQAQVIDATGKEVYPGLVLGLSAIGAVNFSDFTGIWDIDEASNPITPWADITHAFDLRELKLQRMARAGITSYGLSPGMKNLVAGQMAFLHVDGSRTEDVFLARKMALKGNYIKKVKEAFGQKQAPQTRMAMFHMMDEAFRAAREYMDKDKKDYDEGKEVLARALKREIPFVVNVHTQNETESMIQLGKKYNLDMIFAGAYSVEACAGEIIDQGWSVFLGDATSMMVGAENKLRHEALVELYRQGLKLSITCNGDEGYGNAYEQLHWTAALMCRAGATGDEMMDMMTINPARALRMDHLVGSLEPGKQADLIICRGNPALRFDNYIDHTIVAGKQVFKREGA